MTIADQLRRSVSLITADWEHRVRAIPALARLDRRALIDHLPEFLEGVAASVASDSEAAEHAFGLLAEGHAIQRLGHGILIEDLTEEYVALRRAVFEYVLPSVDGTDQSRAELLRLAATLDRAVTEAVRRYARGREEQRERFIGVLAHDLRDPLGVVLMATTTAIAAENLDAARRCLARAVRGAERMRRMIDDVLDFARGQLSGGIPATPSFEDLGEICRAAADELREVHPGRAIEVTTHGDLRGWFDRDRALQAIGNLIRNAIQHGAGAVTVAASERNDRQAVITRVQNRGVVIPQDVLDRIFDPFHGVDARRRLGLGLYIVRQVAAAHAGHVEAASSVDEGTTFTITWPRAPITARSDPRDSLALPPGDGHG
jgi:signal transduction histidine kinase